MNYRSLNNSVKFVLALASLSISTGTQGMDPVADPNQRLLDDGWSICCRRTGEEFQVTDLSRWDAPALEELQGVLRLPGVRSLIIYAPISDEHAAILGQLRSLNSLQICGPYVTDEALKHIGDLTELKWLALDGIAVHDLSFLSRLNRLESLNLLLVASGDVHLESITDLDNLKEFSYESALPLTARDLIELARCNNLETLGVGSAGFQPDALASLVEVPQIRVLRVHGGTLGDAETQWISRLKALEVVELVETDVSGRCLRAIASMPRLERLDLGGIWDEHLLEGGEAIPHVRDITFRCMNEFDLSKLGRLSDLRNLRLRFVTSLKAIDTLNNLESLSLSSILRPIDMSNLHKISDLRSLELHGGRPDGMSWRDIPAIPSLLSLKLDSEWNDIPLRLVPELFPSLEEFTLCGGTLAVGDVASLDRLRHLRVLRLRQPQGLTREILEEIGALVGLVELELMCSDITDDGVTALTALPNLVSLRLSSEKVTDDSVRQLLGLSSLRRLDLSSTSVTWDVVHTLKELPNLKTIFFMARPGILDTPYARRRRGSEGM